LTRVNTDTNALLRTLNFGFSDLIKEPLTVLMVVAYLFYMDWKMTLFVVIFFPLCAIPTAILGRKMKRASQGNVKATISQSSLLVELISSIRVVKAFNLEEQQVQHYRDFSWDLVHHDMKTIQARELVNPIIETISALGLGALIVWIFYTGHTVADLVVFLGGVVSIYTPIKKIAGLLVLFQQSSVGVDRLMVIMREIATVAEPAQPKLVTEFKESIAFESVSFSYGDKLVVKEINLAIPRGFKLGIAGESGSGKSTLVNLAFRFYDPTKGVIKIDGTDLRDISTRHLRQLMALVSQEVVIFDKTAAENIGCGRLGATQAEIEEAARTAYAHDFIMNLPRGYQTRLGERGVTLSGGQRQRICIARAVIRNAPILVLDEATGSLDSEVEAEVQAGIERLAQNRTVISVAHRLSTLANCDHVIVLSNGCVVEQGSFGELLRAGGIFAGMARRQGISANEFKRGA
jgi:subfamily B ATP-binding cassette protein MsbA